MKKALDILLIEDDIDDVDLLKDALLEKNLQHKIEVIMEGDQVFNHLQIANNLPDVIVMDLNLPKTGGREILQAIKATCALAQIPIVVLTTSSSQQDIDYCAKMRISKFITKPATIEGWDAAIDSILQVALSTSKQLG